MLDRNVERDKVAARIKALLSKTTAKGCSEAEAMAAYTKAKELSDKYQIGFTEVELESEGVYEVDCDGHIGRFDIQGYIVSAIARFTDCKTWSKMLDVEDEGWVRRWIFLGLESDADFASWLMVNLEDFIWEKAEDWACEHAIRAAYLEKKTFALGCAARISERLNEEARKRQTEDKSKLGDGKSLIVVKNAIVQREYDSLNLNLRYSRRSSGRMGSGEAYGAGRKAGDKAGFGRPVGGQSGPKLLK